jgi:hypothetical protein
VTDGSDDIEATLGECWYQKAVSRMRANLEFDAGLVVGNYRDILSLRSIRREELWIMAKNPTMETKHHKWGHPHCKPTHTSVLSLAGFRVHESS